MLDGTPLMPSVTLLLGWRRTCILDIICSHPYLSYRPKHLKDSLVKVFRLFRSLQRRRHPNGKTATVVLPVYDHPRLATLARVFKVKCTRGDYCDLLAQNNVNQYVCVKPSYHHGGGEAVLSILRYTKSC